MFGVTPWLGLGAPGDRLKLLRHLAASQHRPAPLHSDLRPPLPAPGTPEVGFVRRPSLQKADDGLSCDLWAGWR